VEEQIFRITLMFDRHDEQIRSKEKNKNSRPPATSTSQQLRVKTHQVLSTKRVPLCPDPKHTTYLRPPRWRLKSATFPICTSSNVRRR
jgi:hypothetical protein